MVCELSITRKGYKTYFNEFHESRLNNRPSYISEYYIEYRVDNHWHRTDGPARIWLKDGYGNIHNPTKKEWWLNYKLIACNSQEEFERLVKLQILW
jgi:hypothetical protein